LSYVVLLPGIGLEAGRPLCVGVLIVPSLIVS